MGSNPTPSARYLATDLNTLINLRDLHQETLLNRHHVRFHLADSGGKGIGQVLARSSPWGRKPSRTPLMPATWPSERLVPNTPECESEERHKKGAAVHG